MENTQKNEIRYKVSIESIQKYEHFSRYPLKTNAYDIWINRAFQKPERIWYKDHEVMLNEWPKTYEEAKKVQIKLVEDLLNYLKNEQA